MPVGAPRTALALGSQNPTRPFPKVPTPTVCWRKDARAQARMILLYEEWISFVESAYETVKSEFVKGLKYFSYLQANKLDCPRRTDIYHNINFYLYMYLYAHIYTNIYKFNRHTQTEGGNEISGSKTESIYYSQRMQHVGKVLPKGSAVRSNWHPRLQWGALSEKTPTPGKLCSCIGLPVTCICSSLEAEKP